MLIIVAIFLIPLILLFVIPFLVLVIIDLISYLKMNEKEREFIRETKKAKKLLKVKNKIKEKERHNFIVEVDSLDALRRVGKISKPKYFYKNGKIGHIIMCPVCNVELYKEKVIENIRDNPFEELHYEKLFCNKCNYKTGFVSKQWVL